jgi:hypothetical protein
MPIFSTSNLNTQQAIAAQAQNRLQQLRNALISAEQYFLWLSAYAQSDLVAVGFSAADATAILSAFADANALYQIYVTGQPPGTYPQAASSYVYAASQRVLVGPIQ